MSIRTRLALVFSLITLGSIAVVYLYVSPSLEDTLRAQKLRSLGTAASAALPALAATVGSNVDRAGVQRAVQAAVPRLRSFCARSVSSSDGET
ncbi:MAG: hypothetical protein NVS1B9_14100 [Solirubrobacteraceae bacterium]